MGGRESDSSSDVVQANLPKTWRRFPAGRTPLDRAHAPPTRAHAGRRIHAAMLARRNGEHTRSINTLRERDRHIAGESAAVIGRRTGAGTGLPTETGGRDSDSSDDVVRANLPETQRRPPGGRTPPDRAHAPTTRAHAGRRIHAAMLARRNGEHTRSINVLRERDRQLAGESAWGVDPQSLGVVIETRRVLVSDGRIFQDR